MASELAPREKEVVRLSSLGCTVHESAKILKLAPSTVDNHKARFLQEGDRQCMASSFCAVACRWIADEAPSQRVVSGRGGLLCPGSAPLASSIWYADRVPLLPVLAGLPPAAGIGTPRTPWRG
ncbi:MAG: hypothetical protein GXX96_22950 [Planctomycetaceae bacterium]|nr:hypothetical protein [Planctomycetaceae bacterium]